MILVMKRVGVKGMKDHTFCMLLITIAIASEKKRKNKIRASVVKYPLIIGLLYL